MRGMLLLRTVRTVVTVNISRIHAHEHAEQTGLHWGLAPPGFNPNGFSALEIGATLVRFPLNLTPHNCAQMWQDTVAHYKAYKFDV